MRSAELETSDAQHDDATLNSPEPTARVDTLVALLRCLKSCTVAFSGGVDSAVVAKAAQLALGDNAVAVTGNSASVAAGELEAARNLAQLIGIRHEVIATGELDERKLHAKRP